MDHYIVVGACSICGCNVTVPRTWHGVQPAPARCEGCGAEAETRPTIQMKRERTKPVGWKCVTRLGRADDMWSF